MTREERLAMLRRGRGEGPPSQATPAASPPSAGDRPSIADLRRQRELRSVGGEAATRPVDPSTLNRPDRPRRIGEGRGAVPRPASEGESLRSRLRRSSEEDDEP
jgi:hypothetical protein